MGDRLPTCPECKLAVRLPFTEWWNDPTYRGTRYVCPDCYRALMKKKVKHLRKTYKGGGDGD